MCTWQNKCRSQVWIKCVPGEYVPFGSRSRCSLARLFGGGFYTCIARRRQSSPRPRCREVRASTMPASCRRPACRAQLARCPRPAQRGLIACCLPDAERRLSKEDAKGSGNILNWQPKVSKAKKQAINVAFSSLLVPLISAFSTAGNVRSR